MIAVRDDYANLMRDFVSRRITAQEFEARYLKKFKGEKRSMDEWTYRILDQVFGDVDAFCGDDLLRQALESEHPGEQLSAEQLRLKVAEALACLEP
jgi:hypothetical protein